MSEKNKLPQEVYAYAGRTELAKLEANKEEFGVWLTCFLVLEFGEEVKTKGCLVEIVDGEDKGKRFLADFYLPHRFYEPIGVSLISAVETPKIDE